MSGVNYYQPAFNSQKEILNKFSEMIQISKSLRGPVYYNTIILIQGQKVHVEHTELEACQQCVVIKIKIIKILFEERLLQSSLHCERAAAAARMEEKLSRILTHIIHIYFYLFVSSFFFFFFFFFFIYLFLRILTHIIHIYFYLLFS